MSSEFIDSMDAAMKLGFRTATDLVTIANTSDMGDVREDATGEALRRLIREVPKDMLSVALAETVKLLAIALSGYSDIIQGRDPMNPTDVPAAC